MSNAKRSAAMALVGTLVVLSIVGICNPSMIFAQQSPARSLGQPIQVQPNPSRAATGAAAGGGGPASSGIMGSARFLRQNRSRRDFVGSNRGDQSGFVGNRQSLGVGQVAPAIGAAGAAALGRGQSAARRNPPLPPLPAKAMYYPRIDFESLEATERTEQWSAEVSQRLADRLEDLSDGSVTARVEDRRAILEGTVRTRAEADKLRRLAEFEPGVDEVVDRLEIANAPAK